MKDQVDTTVMGGRILRLHLFQKAPHHIRVVVLKVLCDLLHQYIVNCTIYCIECTQCRL